MHIFFPLLLYCCFLFSQSFRAQAAATEDIVDVAEDSDSDEELVKKWIAKGADFDWRSKVREAAHVSVIPISPLTVKESPIIRESNLRLYLFVVSALKGVCLFVIAFPF